MVRVGSTFLVIFKIKNHGFKIVLQSISKVNLPISDYVSKIKTLYTELSVIGEKISTKDMIMFFLNDLSSYYNP